MFLKNYLIKIISYERMLKGDVRYRFVIDMATL
jgi:D-arabinose 1-dehydrogenase-like Zn-dependent alcohol dehydrogenase